MNSAPGRTTPTPFATAPGNGCMNRMNGMNSLAPHTALSARFRASRRTVSPLPLDLSSRPRVGSPQPLLRPCPCPWAPPSTDLDHPNRPKRKGQQKRAHRDTTRISRTLGTTAFSARTEFSVTTTPIKRHIKVKGEVNPYDPAHEPYFEKREADHMPDTFRGTRTLRFLWTEQHGLCPICSTQITRKRGGALITAFHVSWVVRKVPGIAFYFTQSATTGFIASAFPSRSRVSFKEAFAGPEDQVK